MFLRAAGIVMLLANWRWLWSGCRAQNTTTQLPAFPYCKCTPSPSRYSLDPAVASPANGTYCFKVRVSPPAQNCSSYCCTKADLRKFELDVNARCDVPGIAPTATLNGVRTRIAPVFDRAPLGPPGATVLKLTQLGLNTNTAADAEICVSLRPTRAGAGCTTLEQLCVPPAGAAPGTCSAVLFDSNVECCPSGQVSVRPCRTCVYFTLASSGGGDKPSYSFTSEQCTALAGAVAQEVGAQAGALSVPISSNFSLSLCQGSQVKVCGTFASAAAAARLRPFIDGMSLTWLASVTGGNSTGACPAALANTTVTVAVGGDGDATDPSGPPLGCLESSQSVTCKTSSLLLFPSCVCNTSAGITPFAVAEGAPWESLPGRRRSSTLYCLTLRTVRPAPGPCSGANVLRKVEIWADEAARGKVLGFSLRSVGASGGWLNISASWGPRGNGTLKATPIAWSTAQADGGRLCVELGGGLTPQDLCRGPVPGHCWVTLFDDSLRCCPLYSTPYLVALASRS